MQTSIHPARPHRVGVRQIAAALALAACLGAAGLAAERASAHADVARVVPAATAAVKNPTAASVTFTGPVARGTIRVTGARGVLASRGTGGRDPRSALRVTVRLKPRLASGVYRVRWTAVALDGHGMRGTYTFRVRR